MANPYASKLTMQIRCFIYAAHHARGWNYPILAKAFQVNDETIAKICRAGRGSRHYRNIFAIYEQIGAERMWQQFGTPELEKRVEQAKNHVYMPATVLMYLCHPDQGEGVYYLKNSSGILTYVPLKFAATIRKTNHDFKAEQGEGVYYKDSEFGWTVPIESAWESTFDALRYFFNFPSSLDSQLLTGNPH